MVITSLENDRVKKYVKLKQKKYRDMYGEFIVEGYHLVVEAYKRGILKEMIIEENEAVPIEAHSVYVTYDIIKKISDVESPPKVMGLCSKVEYNNEVGSRILLLDGLQDPGNIGTIIRSAVAFNVDTVIFGRNTVDLYNPKVLRATQGMMFHINVIFDDLEEVIKKIKSLNIAVYGTKVTHGEDVRKIPVKDKKSYALIVGNEGNGVRDEISDMCDGNLYIRMNDKVESLNVSVATSILLYELGDVNE